MKKKIKTQAVMNDITPSTAIMNIATASLFNQNFIEPSKSPIDQFIDNTNSINVLLGAHVNSLTESVSSLIILGYMSAVESYFRALFRGVINTDEVARRKVETKTVSFAAAIHHSLPLLPEALLESVSFSSPKNIKDSIVDLLGINQLQDKDFAKALEEFGKIVEIRHCCVHRFGRLGSQNAQKLGLSNHSMLFEKPFAPDYQTLTQLALTLRSVVLTINNTVYKKLLERIANSETVGEYSFVPSWNFTKDRAWFSKYYNLFSQSHGPASSPSMKAAYDNFRISYRKMSKATK